MKHSEKHTYTLTYDKNIIDIVGLIDEIGLFKAQWPNAQVNYHRIGEVSISYEGFSNSQNLAFESASQLQDQLNSTQQLLEAEQARTQRLKNIIHHELLR